MSYCRLASVKNFDTPGSFRPDRNSSEAPPPVEMWVIFDSTPDCATAAAESPPPTIENAFDSATARAMANVPCGELRILENAHGTIPDDGLRLSDDLGIVPDGFRTDVESHAGRRRLRHGRDLRIPCCPVRPQPRGPPAVRSTTFFCDALASRSFARSILSVSTSDFPVSIPLARKKRVRHRAADQDRVGDIDEIFDQLDLVGNLCAADDRNIRLLCLRQAHDSATRFPSASEIPLQPAAHTARSPPWTHARDALCRTRR